MRFHRPDHGGAYRQTGRLCQPKRLGSTSRPECHPHNHQWMSTLPNSSDIIRRTEQQPNGTPRAIVEARYRCRAASASATVRAGKSCGTKTLSACWIVQVPSWEIAPTTKRFSCLQQDGTAWHVSWAPSAFLLQVCLFSVCGGTPHSAQPRLAASVSKDQRQRDLLSRNFYDLFQVDAGPSVESGEAFHHILIMAFS